MRNGRSPRSTLVTSPSTKRVPKRRACRRMFSIRVGPSIPSGKPGKFSIDRGGGQLAARLSAVDEQRAATAAGGIDGGGQAGGAGAENDRFMDPLNFHRPPPRTALRHGRRSAPAAPLRHGESRGRGPVRRQFGEFRRGDEAGHRMVPPGGGEVLAESEQGNAGPAQIVQHRLHFLPGFPQAEHQAGFGRDGRGEFPGAGQKAQGALIGGAPAHGGIEAGNGLQVVSEDVGGGGEDGGQRPAVAAADRRSAAPPGSPGPAAGSPR